MIKIISKWLSVILFGLTLILGLIFTFLSTIYEITFENNILDIIIIQIFVTSIFAAMYLALQQNNNTKKWIRFLSHIIISIFVILLYNGAFGSSESCGQRFPQRTEYIKQNLKITHAGFQYGFMDYGSRFIIYQRENFGLERIIGYAENTNYFYGDKHSIRLDLENKILKIDYIDFNKVEKVDSIYIQNKIN
ncbi:MAG: hypothetical protein JW870_18715 [Candidatus Delongbacteria bacterium]|nr:hypothetical protein [Candidatus Delongbacteria bacterium]